MVGQMDGWTDSVMPYYVMFSKRAYKQELHCEGQYMPVEVSSMKGNTTLSELSN